MFAMLAVCLIARHSIPESRSSGHRSHLQAYVHKNNIQSYDLIVRLNCPNGSAKKITLSSNQGSIEHVRTLRRVDGYLVLGDPSRVPAVWRVSESGEVHQLPIRFATDESFAVKNGLVIFSQRRNWEVKRYLLMNIKSLKCSTISRSEAKKQGLSFLDWRKSKANSQRS